MYLKHENKGTIKGKVKLWIGSGIFTSGAHQDEWQHQLGRFDDSAKQQPEASLDVPQQNQRAAVCL